MTNVFVTMQRRLTGAQYDTLRLAAIGTMLMMVVSIVASLFAVATGWTGFSLGLVNGLLLPLFGYIALVRESSFLVHLYASFLVIAAFLFILSSVVMNTIAGGDIIGCLCNAVCADRLVPTGSSMPLGDWTCRHVQVARA
jgi:hypothetical protein